MLKWPLFRALLACSLALALAACSDSTPSTSECSTPDDCATGELCEAGKCIQDEGQAICGDGVVDPGELCDGDCPASCDDGNRCTADITSGSAESCDLTCSYETIDKCQDGDGCCAPGCSPTDDDDCSTSCGDGVVDEDETCDGNCPESCDDDNECTIDSSTGRAEQCSFACVHEPIDECIDGDDCCGSGCDHTTDSDCTAPSGTPLGANAFGSDGYSRAFDLAYDSTGAVVLVGQFSSTLDIDGTTWTSVDATDAFVAKFEADGSLLWVEQFGGQRDQGTRAVTIDSNDNIIVGGYFADDIQIADQTHATDEAGLFVARFAPDGTYLWSHAETGINIGVHDIAVDQDDNIIATGRKNRLYLRKWTSDGTDRWSMDAATGDAIGSSLAVDSSGAVIVTGRINDTVDLGGGQVTSAGSEDIFVARYTEDGTHEWSHQIGGTDSDWGYGVAVSSDDDIFVTGKFSLDVDFDGQTLTSEGGWDMFLARYDVSGNRLDAVRYGGPSSVETHDIVVGPDDQLYVTGWTNTGTDFGGGARTISAGQAAFIASYDAELSYRWDRLLIPDGSGRVDGARLALSTDGRLGLAGNFGGTLTVGSTTITSQSSYDMFFAEFQH